MSKVPVVLQLEMVECGAASLAMVMAYYKKWVPLEQLRVDCGVSRDGSNAKNVVKVARMYGFEASGCRAAPSDLGRSVPLPCIIHWNMNHFVVLTKLTDKFAHINDPARGEVKVPMEQFDTSFTGIALSIVPGEDFEPGGKPVSVWPFIKGRLQGAAPVFVFILTVSALMSVIGIISSMFGRVFIDDLLSGNHPEWTTAFIALYLGVNLLSILLSIVDKRTNLKISGKFAVVSSSMFMWHALRLPMEFYASRYAGDIAARQSENDRISLDLIKLFAPLFVNAVMMVLYLFIVLQYSVLMTVIGFAAMLINYAVNHFITQKSINISRVSSRDSGKLSSLAVAGVEMIETIKAAGAEDGFFERWSGLHAAVNDSRIKSIKLQQRVGLVPQIVSQVMNIVIMMIGAFLIMRGEMTVGIFFAFQGFLNAFIAPFTALLETRLQMQRTKVSMERVQDVLNYKTDVQFSEPGAGGEKSATDGKQSEGGQYAKLSGTLEVRNLTFGYSRLSEPLLDNFNLSLRPGGSVALVGASGCGKSTIAKLISNLYKPWSGQVLFDNKSADEIPREIFTCSVSVVDQDIILFNDTIGNNIKTWDKSIEDRSVMKAASDAQIHRTIVDREGGYAAHVLEGGKNFSGGERQRLEIAGALAKEPAILIMDEATSALDAKTEFDVVNAIRDRKITTIIVAHRLSTIRDCDEIIVLDKGKVVQRGTHDELYAQEGRYKELVSMS